MNYTYKYARPAVTVDIILFNENQELLLIKRAANPFAGAWAFPGGFIDENEELENATRRELLEETGLMAATLLQFRTFGQPGRDPRGHTVSVVYCGLVKDESALQAADDAAEAQWYSLSNLPDLAFDHEVILKQFFQDSLFDQINRARQIELRE